MADLSCINKPTARLCLCFRQPLAYLRAAAAPTAAAGGADREDAPWEEAPLHVPWLLVPGVTHPSVARGHGADAWTPGLWPELLVAEAAGRPTPAGRCGASPGPRPPAADTGSVHPAMFTCAAPVATAPHEAVRQPQGKQEAQGPKPQHREAAVRAPWPVR